VIQLSAILSRFLNRIDLRSLSISITELKKFKRSVGSRFCRERTCFGMSPSGVALSNRLILAIAIALLVLRFAMPLSAQDLTNLIEGDCYPPGVTLHPPGDGSVRYSDWARVLYYALGFQPPTGYDFALADCAPRATSGDGAITAADFVQCYRYSLGLDPIQPGGGPTNPVSARVVIPLGPERTISISGTNMVRGQNNSVTILAAGQGDERAFAFTLQFDTNQLQFKRAFGSTNQLFANAFLNTNKVNSGVLGAVFALGTNNSLGYSSELMQIEFMASTNADHSTTISFGDDLAIREVANANADVVQTSFQGAIIYFSDCRLDAVKAFAQGLEFTLTGSLGAYVVETSSNLIWWSELDTLTNLSGSVPFVETLAILPHVRFYRARRLP
jgi:hypothetical protein